MEVDERCQDHTKRGYPESEERYVIADVATMDGAQAPNRYGRRTSERVLAGPVPGKRQKGH